jgi:hypothetical protein
VRARIGKRSDDLQDLHDRARPAVGDDQRQGTGLRRADVDAVNAGTVDRGGELRERVEMRLVRPPVICGPPVRSEILEVVQRDSVAPADARKLIRPAGPIQSSVQVVKVGLWDLDTERSDRLAHVILTGARRRGRTVHLCNLRSSVTRSEMPGALASDSAA